MALIKCPECGREVSDLAASCPYCGCPIKKEESSQTPTSSMQYKVTKQIHSELKARHMVGIICGIIMIPLGILSLVATTFEDVARNSVLKTGATAMGILAIVLGIFCAVYSIIKYRQL